MGAIKQTIEALKSAGYTQDNYVSLPMEDIEKELEKWDQLKRFIRKEIKEDNPTFATHHVPAYKTLEKVEEYMERLECE